MSGVDNRIVTMKFDNAQFEQGARTSLSTLQKLKEGMNFGSVGTAASKALGGISGLFAKFGIKNPFATAEKGAADLGKAAGSVSTGGLSSMDGAITGISNKFLALSTIAITALSNITSKAMASGTAFLKSFSTAPIMDGLHEYELNLKSIQTVQANTDQPLEKINASLEELNRYSDQTIYNFSEMARNVGTFTAAGVDLKTSVSSIKGIANLAALSGSSSEQAATAMYQLSQAIASGKVGLMDWNSVVNAGMGGKKLQNALAQTAVAMGEIEPSETSIDKMGKLSVKGMSFRESIMAKPGQESWLSSDILVNTLAVMDGRFSSAALAAEKTETGLKKYSKAQIEAKIATARTNLEQKNGVKYTDEQFKALQKMSTAAFKSATEVKTLGQVFDVAKETIASGWSSSFRNIFGDLKQAKKLFTGMSGGLNDIINRNALARNTLLAAWSKMGGRSMLIEGLKNSFTAISKILGTISFGFRQIFPAKTGEQLVNMTESFLKFTEKLIISDEIVGKLRWTFKGLFAIVGIVMEVLGHVVDLFQRLAGVALEGGGGFLDFTAKIGMWLTEVYKAVKYGRGLYDFFDKLGDILVQPIELIKEIASALGALFGGVDLSGASGLADVLGSIGTKLANVLTFSGNIDGAFDGIVEFLGNLGSRIGEALTGIGTMVANALTSESFEPALSAINTGLLAGLVLMLKRFFSGGINVDVGGGFLDSVKESLGAATESLQNMQANLKADILLKIAGALAILAASLFLLSTIDSRDLAKALIAMGGGFMAMQFAMVSLNAAIGIIGAAKLPLIAGAMFLLASSLLVLAGAMKIMGAMDLHEIARGLLAIGGVLFVINKAMAPMAAGAGGMIRAAAAIAILGFALNVLALAMKIFATFNWEEMAKGLAGVVGSLTAIAVAMKLMPKGILLQAAGILVLSVALNALAVALKIFATMSWQEMGKGAAALAGSLTLIALAMRMMPMSLPVTAAGLVLVALALNGIAAAIKVMGGMSWKQIGKGLVTLGGAIVILAAGLNAMGPMSLLGAAALTVAAAALAVLTPVLITLGSLDWMTIIKSLTTLAGIFVILGLAGFILAPVVPVILGLAAAMVLIGAGLALAGVGALAFATAFGVIVGAGAAGVQVLAGMLGTIIAAIPGFFAALGEAMGRFAGQISKNGPQFTRAMSTIIGSMLDAIIRNAPKMGRAFMAMLNTALKVISTMAPKIFNAGLKLIVGFLSAIERNIGKIVNLASGIVVNFINGIARNLGRIIQAGVNLIIKFIDGVAQAIDNNSTRIGESGAKLGIAMVRGMANGIAGAGGIIKDAAVNVAQDAYEEVKDFLKIGSPSKLMRDEVGARVPQGMALGIKDDTPLVVREIGTMGETAISKLARVMQGVDDAFALNPNFDPTISPVLDLTALTKEANKMSSILATAPIMAGVSYQTAADISAMTQASAEAQDGPDGPDSGGGGDKYVTLEQHLHSPKPIDSVEAYRAGKTLISLAKEALS